MPSSKDIIILGIESSCDETAVAVCRDGIILSNIVATQEIHRQYGGVVPELASRAHMQNIVPVVDTAIRVAGIDLKDVTAFAFTRSPGLIGSLMVGAQFAKSLALALDKPLLSIDHMHAHVVANLIDEPHPSFPFLCLTVSGGHTQIVKCESPVHLTILGETIDDAAGEAFDKSAKLLGLPYPGGPLIDKYAKDGSPKFSFPEPKIPGLDFSFSGLKTSILYFLENAGKSNTYKEVFKATQEEKNDFIKKNLNDICASIQQRIITILLNKLKKASQESGIMQICLAGGVSANSGLRKAFTEKGIKEGWYTYIPSLEYCTDNAGMIAMAGYHKYLYGEFADLSVTASARTTG